MKKGVMLLMTFVFVVMLESSATAQRNCPNAGTCPRGTCGQNGGTNACNVANCAAANCKAGKATGGHSGRCHREALVTHPNINTQGHRDAMARCEARG
jgi:hypothetical protein